MENNNLGTIIIIVITVGLVIAAWLEIERYLDRIKGHEINDRDV